MLNNLLDKIKSIKNQTSDRTAVAKKNVIISLFVKGLSIFNSLLLVPLTINYINSERYGIWLTISSVILWLNFFDFGLGNGLRNKLTEAIATGDKVVQKALISSGYLSLIVFSSILLTVLYLLNPFISWDKILGISAIYHNELTDLIGVLFLMYCIQFVLQIINTIFYAFQLSALVSANFLLGSVFSLVFILILKVLTKGSLYWLGVSYFGGNLLSMLIFSIYFFIKLHPELVPSYKLASFKVSKNVLNLGSQFFVIQLAGVIQYQAVNVIISRFFSSVIVTEYNIAYKYFSIVLMMFGILMTPIWSAVTDAKAASDFLWIRKTANKLLSFWVGCAVVAVILLFISPYIFPIWIGNSVTIPFKTSLGVMIYVLSMTFGSIYVNILNGLGLLRTQFTISIFTMILFIPLAYFLSVSIGLGVFGISLSLVLANINGLVAAPYEFYHYLKKNS